MRPVVTITLLLMVNISQAQAFKCERGTGKVIYQNEECADSGKQKEIDFKESDPDKTRNPQKKKNKE